MHGVTDIPSPAAQFQSYLPPARPQQDEDARGGARRSGAAEVLVRHSSAQRFLFTATASVLVASMLLGGATRAGFLADVMLQLLAVPLLLLALWVRLDLRPARQTAVLVFCLALLAIVVAQLIPLPPAIWTALPNRLPTVKALELAGQDLPWLPVSVSPQMTALAAVSLVLPFAVVLATSLLGYGDRRRLSLLALAVGLIGMVAGMLQTAQGEGSPFYFYETTNIGLAVGFMANRNHHAAVMYVSLIFAVAWTLRAREVLAANDATVPRLNAMLLMTCCVVVCLALIFGALLARSRTGLLLTMVALFAGFLMFVGRRSPKFDADVAVEASGRWRALKITAVVGFLAVQVVLVRLLERIIQDPLADPRVRFFRNTWEAMLAYLPFGSGIGTFVPVYARSERIQDISAEYANRAHNDVLEFTLEAGVAAIVLMAAFALWMLVRGIVIWRDKSDHGVGIDGLLARAAAVAVALLIAHSFVDYPLRTSALIAFFAFSCALLVPPPAGVVSGGNAGTGWLSKALMARGASEGKGGRRQSEQDKGNRSSKAKQTVAASPAPGGLATGARVQQPGLAVPPSFEPPFPASVQVSPPALPAGPTQVPQQSTEKSWGEDVAWPQEWRAQQPNTPPGPDGKPPKGE